MLATGCLGAAPDGVDGDADVANAASAIAATEAAAAFAWNSVVDTDQPLTALASNFTLGANVLIQHPHAQSAPIFASRLDSSAFSLFYDYNDVAPGTTAKLVLRLGGMTATYAATPLATLDSGGFPLSLTWHEVVLVRNGTRVQLYLDGAHQVGSGNVDGAGDLIVPSGPVRASTDTLRLGRGDASDAVSQFYGFIDEVAFFNRAFSASEVSSTFSPSRKLAGSEANLTGYYSFDLDAPVPKAAHHTATLAGGAVRQTVGHSLLDFLVLPAPKNATTMHLPFRVGTAFQVLWGNEINSHIGGAAFCWDFVAIGPGFSSAQVQSTTNGQALFASAAGTVIEACDQGDDACNGGQLASKGPLIDGYDSIKIQHAPNEISTFLHIKINSVTEAFAAHGLASPSAVASPMVPVTNGQWVARIGTRSAPGAPTNYHLHFAFGTSQVTVPMAFSNYEASDDSGATWHTVARGVPSQGQWVRGLH